jgi:hypothetical protein
MIPNKLIPTANTCVDAFALRGRQAYFSLSILNVINPSINLLIDKDLRGLFSSIVFYLPFLIKKSHSFECKSYLWYENVNINELYEEIKTYGRINVHSISLS